MSADITLNMKQFTKLINEYHLEDACLDPFDQIPWVELFLDDTVVIIDKFIKSEGVIKSANYHYPENWKDLDNDILEKSIRYHYASKHSYQFAYKHLTPEEIVKQGIILFDDIPWSRVQFVPNKVYNIIEEIFYENDVVWRC